MPFSLPAASQDLTHVEVDLRDVLGAAGVRPPSQIARELEQAVGGSWTQLETDGELFLAESEALPVDASGAFPPSEFDQVVADVILRSEPMAEKDRVVGVVESFIGRHEYRQQIIDGAPVVGANYGLHWGKDRTMTVTGNPLGDLQNRDPGPRPHRSQSEVRRAMRRSLGLPGSVPVELELAVFPLEGRGIWSYEGRCILEDPVVDLRIFLRAEDLQLLLSYDIACASYGEGNVFPVNPVRTPDIRPVLLDGFGSDFEDELSGVLIDVSPHRGSRVSREGHDYRIGPSHPGFDEVSAYYHASAAAIWFAQRMKNDIFEDHPFSPIKVITNDRRVRPTEVAQYVPDAGEIRLSAMPERNPARSAEIVFHEFTHAITDRVCKLNHLPVNMQARIVNEGLADYCACSAMGDPRFGDYVKNMPSTGARNCSVPVGAPSEPYGSGQRFAAFLWDLRSEFDPGIADLLITQSIYYLDPSMTLERAKVALIEADRELFSNGNGAVGRHGDVINEKYADRFP